MSTTNRFSLTDSVRLAATPSLSDEVKRASRVRRRPLTQVAPAFARGPEKSLACDLETPVVVIGGGAALVRKPIRPSAPKPRVFLAHGHDHAARLEVTRFLERAGFEAIVMNEQANQGLTIIEKIEACPAIDFAIILMTPDDECVGAVGNTRRARQNVIWEHGYFAAKLGRAKTCVLIKGDVEIPSDIKGKMWVDFDARGAWRVEVAKEMRAASLPFEADALL